MEESGPHKQSILRNKEVSLKNAPRKPRDVTRPTVMVKRLGFRGTLPVKYKIDFWNNPITASILVWNQVVLNQSQQLGYLNSKLMLSWDCPFKRRIFFFFFLFQTDVNNNFYVSEFIQRKCTKKRDSTWNTTHHIRVPGKFKRKYSTFRRTRLLTGTVAADCWLLMIADCRIQRLSLYCDEC